MRIHSNSRSMVSSVFYKYYLIILCIDWWRIEKIDMGILRFDIELENSSKTWEAGSIISGKVYLELDSPKPSNGLKVTIYGRSKIRFKRGKHWVRAKQIHIDADKYLLGSASGPGVVISAGKHFFPFSFQLPQDIPNTYADSIGTVKYRVKATIRRAWYLANHRTWTGFEVIVPLDLNSDNWNAAKSVLQCTSQTFVGCSETVDASVSLPVRGCIPGQTMPATVNIKNRPGLHIIGVIFSLVQVNLYHGTYNRTRRNERVLAEKETPVELSDAEMTLQCFFQIPMVQPSFLMHSSLIDIEYLIRVEVRIGGFHLNIKIDVPIIIGSLALLTSTVQSASSQQNYDPDCVPTMKH